MRLSREFAAGFSLVAVLGVGATACSSANSGGGATPTSVRASAIESSSACTALNSLNLIGGSKDGGENAKNTGDCVALYDPATLKTVGEIASGQSLIIECQTKLTSFKVEEGRVIGYTNLDGAALRQYEQGVFKEIPSC